MYFANRFKCDSCGEETENSYYDSRDSFSCSCGGQFHWCGESYDQEFIDEQKYNDRQDREYEERHRHDY
ncbi:MAG: hypothetical protein PHH73_03910 [Candidatus Rickettsiella isopodorum]|nr:hypothetical protein [Candidatus Rickettsiella isopodorum]